MKIKQPSQRAAKQIPNTQLLLVGALALSWFVMVLAASSRVYYVLNYQIGKMIDPIWEPFAASNIVVVTCGGVIAAWLVWFGINSKSGRCSQRGAVRYLAISLVPLLIWVLRAAGVVASPALFWEAIWMAAWTGLSFGELARSEVEPDAEDVSRQTSGTDWTLWLVLVSVSLLVGGWWFSQSVEYYQNFMLGFNDFGHFLQRVANTAEGRGVLMESPVLPMFWDHFNPGLLLVVPLWKIYPSVNLVFGLQAGALAGSSLLIYAISRRLGHAPWAALIFGVAWLVQPCVGQMNLAYTYGWHPITFAIPLLLAAILCLLAKHRLAALGFTVLALTMEEGVFVIVALVAAVCGAVPFIERWINRQEPANDYSNSGGLVGTLPTAIWFTIAVTSVIGFVMVYKFSGMAEFQTGRFVALGNSPVEILFSPIFRPGAFWGQVLRWENVLFLALLWLPCGLPALLRGWRYLLPTLLPLGVLVVWDHAPAHSLAFQYPSTLLPVFWLASLSGAAEGTRGSEIASFGPRSLPSAITALITGLVLSLFVGQLPFSSPTLMDVEAMTYGADTELRRKSDAEDGRWLTQQVAQIREAGDECLATSRIAAHLVGNRDIETVGQYALRRDQLSKLPDRKGAPIKHYRWIILDRQELASLSYPQIAAVEVEAGENGFELVEDRFGVAIFRRPEPD